MPSPEFAKIVEDKINAALDAIADATGLPPEQTLELRNWEIVQSLKSQLVEWQYVETQWASNVNQEQTG